MAEILEQMEHAEVRRLITEDKVRPDGRRVMKFVLWMLKLIFCQRFMGQVSSRVGKPRPYQS